MTGSIRSAARHLLLASLPFLAVAPFPAEAQNQTLRIGMRDDPDILDPTLSRTYVGTVVMTALCDKLFDFDEKLNIVPMLATGHEWADEKNLIIRLRPGVTFHDGTPFDAAAVKYTLERHLTMQGSYRRSEIGAMDHAEVVDPLTVRVVMKRPFAPFVAVLTDRAGMMVSPRAAEAAGRDFGRAPVCAGPFRFVERVAQDRVVVERFPGYWDAGRIHYNRVQYSIMPNSTARLANLQSGALDITEVAPLDAETVAKDRRLALFSMPSLGYGAITVNLGGDPAARTPLGRDARVRHAFSLSLDRKALTEVVFAGLYEPTAQPTSPASPLHIPSITPPGRDIPRARALLREAGVATPLKVSLVVYNTPQAVQSGEVIQAMAAEAGFEVEVKAYEFGAALTAVNNGEFAMHLGGWSGLLDTDSNSWSMLHTGGALNMARYSNADVDAALDRARESTDIGTRRAAYEAAWQQVWADLPLIYLWQTRNLAGASRRIAGFRLLADGLIRLQDVRPAP